MINKDVLWKGIIEDLVEEFVHFFFAEYVDQIDFSKGFVFLDKELQQISPKSSASLRRADKLFKAWLKTGKESWFLVHVEVQGYNDPAFAQRMFEYAYRILDRYHRPVTALVIYTHTDQKYQFQEYRYSFLGTELNYRFQTFILMDHEPKALRASGNLFGLILEVARKEMKMVLDKKEDSVRFEIKLELVKHLFEQGIPKSKIRHLLDFISAYIGFEKPEFLHKFEEEIDVITKTNNSMGIREAILNDVKEQGIEEGIEQGIHQKERIVVSRAWKKGLPVKDIADLVDIDIERVKAIIKQLEMEKGDTPHT
jgi:predicted transposase/invertase (TIGR01784 family)